MVAFRWLAAGAAMVWLVQPGPAAHAQSFNCAKARTATERTICEAPLLGQLDTELAKVYRAALAAGHSAPATVRQEQRAWLSNRDSCGDDFRCLRRAYIRRVNALRGAEDPLANWPGTYVGPFGENDITISASPDGLMVAILGGAEFYICEYGPARADIDGRAVTVRVDGDTLTLRRVGTGFLMPDNPDNQAVQDDWCGMRAPYLPGNFFPAE